MYIKMVNRVFDDKGVECKENDRVLVRTKYMDSDDDLLAATIVEIYTNLVVLRFEDRLVGTEPIAFRKGDLTEFIYAKDER